MESTGLWHNLVEKITNEGNDLYIRTKTLQQQLTYVPP